MSTNWIRKIATTAVAASAVMAFAAPVASARGYSNCSSGRACFWDDFGASGGFAQWDHHTIAGGFMFSMGSFSNRASSYKNADNFRIFVGDNASNYSACLNPGQYGNFGSGNNIIDAMGFSDTTYCQ
jgi:hypothetical protein